MDTKFGVDYSHFWYYWVIYSRALNSK